MAFTDASTITLGIVGYGNMGRALALGVSAKAELADHSLLIHEKQEAGAQAAAGAGFALAAQLPDLALRSDIILLAVKPDQVAPALEQMAPAFKPGSLLVSIAAGIPLTYLAKYSQGRCALARVMPNTPALVGQGVFGLCFDKNAPQDTRQAARRLFSSLGLLIELDEDKMNAFTALSGSGPGYVFHFLESLAEAGVSVGLDRASSKSVALALLRGCAAMAEQAEQTDKMSGHAAILREQVSSPGGTTIAGLNHLDRSGARGMLIDAVRAACLRGEEMERALETAK
ncbi:pyrroline-5-carboxylate reductase [Desulfovibrio sp. OttesenSCG-928-M14]|nr:pyrroline-5-carboxylate reductase [Desulfovibrio sp. OttesenSCG-928-M14]